MLIYTVHRTQIYLSDTLRAVLERLSEQTGVSRSELIRRALERAYLGGRSGSNTREPRADYASSAGEVQTWEVTAASAGGGAFEFWDSDDEDVYLPTDGEPLE